MTPEHRAWTAYAALWAFIGWLIATKRTTTARNERDKARIELEALRLRTSPHRPPIVKDQP